MNSRSIKDLENSSLVVEQNLVEQEKENLFTIPEEQNEHEKQ